MDEQILKGIEKREPLVRLSLRFSVEVKIRLTVDFIIGSRRILGDRRDFIVDLNSCFSFRCTGRVKDVRHSIVL